jgi:hypothetical protein
MENFSSFSSVLKQILSSNFNSLLCAARVASPVMFTGIISRALQAPQKIMFLSHTVNQSNGHDLEPTFVTSSTVSFFFTMCSLEGRAAETWKPNDSSPKFPAHPK